jgi:DNA processing protein
MGPSERAAWLRLLVTPGVGRATARQLLAAFGSPEGIWTADPAARQACVGPSLAGALERVPEGWTAETDRLEAWLGAQPDRHLIPLGDARYPAALLETPDPPLVLFVQGQADALIQTPALAVVGSRNPTPQGAGHARQFAHALAEAGVMVVSGLALGVDGEAHAGALDGGGRTLAFVGTGLDRVYPARHRDLAHRIAAEGALVSEFPLGTPPLAHHFPQRNRLIAGLTQGTLVVEAALASGSLITARQATEMGREVFAIPGSIHAPQSRGCHALIRQGAQLVESVDDILQELRWSPAAAARAGAPDAAPAALDPLLEAMGHDPIGLDALQDRTGLDTARLMARLLELELDGQVGRLPGGRMQRLARG